MGEWLLTVEERRKIWDDATKQKMGDWEEELLQAQLRKVVERLFSAEACPHHRGSLYLRQPIECSGCWAELRQQAGLDV